MGNKSSAEVNTAQAVHTPTPWQLDIRKPGNEQLLTITCGGTWIATFHADNETTAFQAHPCRQAAREYAEQAVRAVNSHAELVSILRRTLAFEGRLKACDCDGGRLLVADIRRVLSVNEEVQS